MELHSPWITYMGNLTAQTLAGHQKWKKKPKRGNVNAETDGDKKQMKSLPWNKLIHCGTLSQ